MTTKRPNIVKVFAGESTYGNYLPIKFGTNIPASKTNYEEVANDNFEYGLESLEGDLQLKDLNSIFFYQGKLLQYLFQQGIPEFSAYQDYPMGAVAQYNGDLWVATKDIKASVSETKPVKTDPCNPCAIVDACAASKVCQEPANPSKENGWCKLVTHCTFDNIVDELRGKDTALEQAIKNLKGVAGFEIKSVDVNGTQVPSLVLNLSDGNSLTIPLVKFGHIEQLDTGDIKVTNADGSKLTIKAHKATTRVMDTKGDLVGFVHTDVTPDDVKSFTKTITLVNSDALDGTKGFYWNTNTHKWQVDLSDLVQSNSGLTVDKDGNISIDPEYTKTRDAKATEAKNQANAYTEEQLKALKENGAKVFANSPITGDGTKTNPLGLALNEKQLSIVNGKLTITGSSECVEVHDLEALDTGLRKQGFTCFYGSINKRTGAFVKGVPYTMHDKGVNYARAVTSISDWGNDGEEIADFSGYQVATPNEVLQFIFDDYDATATNTLTVSGWVRAWNAGMSANGTLNTSEQGKWRGWYRISNLSVNPSDIESMVTQLSSLKNQVNNLENRVSALESPCKNTVKQVTDSYTLQNTDNIIVSTAGTLTVPAGLTVGRQFEVVQGNTTQLTLVAGSGVTLVPPYEGSLKLAGSNAVVTLLVDNPNHVRVFGQTVSA